MAKKKKEQEAEKPTEQASETDKAAGQQSEEAEEQKFDLLIPPGVPRKIIFDIVEKYDVEVVSRKEKLFFANMEGDEREILAFRGKKEVLEEVQNVMLEGLRKYIEGD
jgi:hypothetical protein